MLDLTATVFRFGSSSSVLAVLVASSRRQISDMTREKHVIVANVLKKYGGTARYAPRGAEDGRQM